LASKYEEIYPPELKELVYITDRAYNKEEIIQMETEIICTLDYQCTIPTAHTFLCRYLKAAHADRTMVQLACYLAERSLQEMSVVRFIPSTIAATAILIARKTLKRHPWSPTLLKYTGLDEAGMADCVLDMKGYLENSTASQQHAVYRKYSGPKFGSVAALELVF
jgi:cyclin B